MKNDTTIHLGFEVGTGKPVSIPCRHMVVTGQTQEAGKTTTLEALISRSGQPAIAFVTKRGEQSFTAAIEQPPYFRERADWQFVSSVLEAAMREKMKFERNWIIKASKGAKTLADVHKNVKALLTTARGINEGVYTTLDAYLEIVVPRVRQVNWATSVQLRDGINVMNLSNREKFPAELQSLVMCSVLDWVYEKAEKTITIIPEAWEFIPQGRNSPVKMAAIQLVRKGAGLGNYVWLDSQDIGGVDKEMLRQCPVWLIGVQREANEIDRVLSNIPAGIAKPSRADVAMLSKGQFYACWGQHVIKTYVQPEWMTDGTAQQIALGNSELPLPNPKMRPKQITEPESTMTQAQENELRQQLLDAQNEIVRLNATILKQSANPAQVINQPAPFDEQALIQRILANPAIANLRIGKPELNVSVTREVIEIDGKTCVGQVALLISKGFFDSPKNGNTVHVELKRLGFPHAKPSAYDACAKLAKMGFLTVEATGYQAVVDMKINIKKA